MREMYPEELEKKRLKSYESSFKKKVNERKKGSK